jgi:hypothetical protein
MPQRMRRAPLVVNVKDLHSGTPWVGGWHCKLEF